LSGDIPDHSDGRFGRRRDTAAGDRKREETNPVIGGTAGLVEECRKDREEYRQLWRQTNEAITRLAEESRAADARLEAELRQFAAEARTADQELRGRIEGACLSVWQFLAK
jgi:hypothetical protein